MADRPEWKPKLAEVLENFHAIPDNRIRLSYNHKDGYLVFPEFKCHGCANKDIYANKDNFDTANLELRVKKSIKFLLSIDPPLTLEKAAKTITKSCGKPIEYDDKTEDNITLTYKASTSKEELNLPYPFKLASFDEEVIFNLAPANPDSIVRK